MLYPFFGVLKHQKEKERMSSINQILIESEYDNWIDEFYESSAVMEEYLQEYERATEEQRYRMRYDMMQQQRFEDGITIGS